jgi:hypothetical protein
MKTRPVVLLSILAVLAVTALVCEAALLLFIPVVRKGAILADSEAGPIVTTEVEIGRISGVELATFGDLTIEVGEREALRIETEQRVHDRLAIEIRGTTLYIRRGDGVWLGPRPAARFYLTVRELDSIVASANGNVTAPGLSAEHFTIQAVGSGDVHTERLDAGTLDVVATASGDIDVTAARVESAEVAIRGSGDVRIGSMVADKLTASMSSSGNLEIGDGQVTVQSLYLTGSGEYRASQLQSNSAEVRIAGSGSATLRVEERLDARITGSGDVRYVGSPSVESSTPGSGDVSRISD